MGLPTWEDNLQAYKISDVTAKADKFRNKKLLIVHGTAGNIYVLSRKITILNHEFNKHQLSCYIFNLQMIMYIISSQ